MALEIIIDGKLCVDVSEVAQKLGVSLATARRYIDSGSVIIGEETIGLEVYRNRMNNSAM